MRIYLILTAADRNPADIIRKITAGTEQAGDGTMENK